MLVEQARGEDEQVGVVDRRHRALALGVAVGDRAQVSSRSARRGLGSSDDLLERAGRSRPPARRSRRWRAGLGSAGRVSRPASTASRAIAASSAWSSASRIVKAAREADQRAVAGSRRRQTAWKVPAVTPRRSAPPARAGPVDHLPRRPAGEGDQHDRLGRRAGLDQVGQRGDDRPRLARSGRGQHQRPAAAPSTAASCSSSSIARRRSEAPAARARRAQAVHAPLRPGRRPAGRAAPQRPRAAFCASMCGSVGGAVCQRGYPGRMDMGAGRYPAARPDGAPTSGGAISRSRRSSPIRVLASRHLVDEAAEVGERPATTSIASSSSPATPSTRAQVGRQEAVDELGEDRGGGVEPPEVAPRARRPADLLGQLAPAHPSGSSPGWSSLPAGSSSVYPSIASRGWRTSSTWSPSTGTITTAPGVVDHLAPHHRAVGAAVLGAPQVDDRAVVDPLGADRRAEPAAPRSRLRGPRRSGRG